MQQLQSGTTLQGGKYRIERVLGQGGFGITYLARNTVFDIDVAIKEFFMKDENDRDGSSVTMPNTTKQELFHGQMEKFKKEAKRMFAIKNEHIVGVQDLFEENGTAYYVMDYVDGENLAERLKRTGKPMSEQEVRDILPQILDALKSIHDAGIWHLDLKPANLLIDKTGNVKLIDFGASKQLNAQKGGATTSTAISYTNGYAPREQMEQNYDKFGPWTDIYALGATLYNLLTNNKPPLPTDIDDDMSEDKHVALPFPESVGGMKYLVLQMMKTNRLQRPQNIDAIDIGTKQEQSPASGSRCSQDSHWVKSPWSTDEEGEETVIDNSRYIQKNKSQIGSNSKEKLTQSACGIIFVQCSSGKASVVIDNKYYGMTPLKTTVNEGAHVVNIIKDNLNRTHNVTVWKGQTVELRSSFPQNKDQSSMKDDSSFIEETSYQSRSSYCMISNLILTILFCIIQIVSLKILPGTLEDFDRSVFMPAIVALNSFSFIFLTGGKYGVKNPLTYNLRDKGSQLLYILLPTIVSLIPCTSYYMEPPRSVLLIFLFIFLYFMSILTIEITIVRILTAKVAEKGMKIIDILCVFSIIVLFLSYYIRWKEMDLPPMIEDVDYVVVAFHLGALAFLYGGSIIWGFFFKEEKYIFTRKALVTVFLIICNLWCYFLYIAEGDIKFIFNT